MRYGVIVFLSTWMIASAAIARTLPSPRTDSGDSWAKPATASSAVNYRDSATVADKSSKDRFKFKNNKRFYPVDQPPPGAMDKASVMGAQRPWQNGQPPVECAMTPQAAACRR